jgi:hypothetical protein
MTPGARPERRLNRGGTQRAFRFALLYVLALVVVDVVLVALDLDSPEAGRAAVEAGLELFLGVAVVLAVGSIVYALTPAPRLVEVGDDRVVVVGRWGHRRSFPPLSRIDSRVVRRYPEGFLSRQPVELVQVTDRRGRRRTYQVEAGLLDPIYDPEQVG